VLFSYVVHWRFTMNKMYNNEDVVLGTAKITNRIASEIVNIQETIPDHGIQSLLIDVITSLNILTKMLLDHYGNIHVPPGGGALH